MTVRVTSYFNNRCMISFAVVNRAVYCVVLAQDWLPWYVAMRIRKGCCSAWFLISFVASVVQELGRMNAVLTRHCVADVSIKENCTSRARGNPHCSKLFSGSRATLALCDSFRCTGRMAIRMCSMRCVQAESSEFANSLQAESSAVCGSTAPCATLYKWL